MDGKNHALPSGDAVLCSLAELPDGRLRVALDNLRKADAAGLWRHRTFVTYQDYPADMLAVPGGLSDAELAEFGFNVLVRLLAINGRLPDADDPPDSDAHLNDTQRRSIASLTD